VGGDSSKLNVNGDQEHHRLCVGQPGPSFEEQGETRTMERGTSIEHFVRCCTVRQEEEKILWRCNRNSQGRRVDAELMATASITC
jgi:hypothetical protein